MNVYDIEFQTRVLETLCEVNFKPTFANVTVHYIAGKWIVRADSPKIYASSDSLELAIDDATKAIKSANRQQSDLARTLGVEAAE